MTATLDPPPATIAAPSAIKTKPKTNRRSRLRKWATPPRRLTFTRAGRFFMMMTLGVGLGALNTGNNLLFLLLGMMLSAIIASGILSEAVIRRLRVHRKPPKRIFARRPAPSGFVLHNPRSYLSVNIELVEQNPTCLEGPLKELEIGERDLPFWKFWVMDHFEDDRYVAITRLPIVSPYTRKEYPSRHIFPERGKYLLPGPRIATRFPFGFFHKVSDVKEPEEIVVFPEPLEAEDWVGEVMAKFGDISKNKAGFGDEYFGLRDWRDGEDQRQIHWKSSAKRGTFVVREFEEEEQRAVHVVLMTSTGMQSEPPELMKKRFEQGLRKAVGLLQGLQQHQFRVGLTVDGHVIDPGLGQTHLDRMFHVLATVELTSGQGEDVALPTVPEHVKDQMAYIGIGFHAALQGAGQEYDQQWTIDELEV